MPDQGFFKRQKAMSLKDIADLSGADLAEGTDPDYVVEDVAPLDTAGRKDISFLDNVKYKDQFRSTKAGACFVAPEFQSDAPEGINLLLSASPYKSYALAAQEFYPQEKPEGDISDQAFIHPEAKLGEGCVVEAGAVIGAGAQISDHSWIEANAVISENVKIGQGSRVGPGATVSHALIGDYVRIYPGVRIGQDGFGFAIDPKGHVKVPQLGRVIIEDHVEIGANTTIDRGSGPDTVIGQGTWIDNLVQIAHNVKIGKGCIIVSQVGISGSTVIEDFVMLGGQVGVTGHLRIGSGARIGAQAGVMRDVPAGEEQIGSPAVPSKQHMRQIVALNRLIQRKKTS